eukprot:TRINITY_DN133625_c0_g1_i2.p1 TRINITY_DN133625_c0_g1~~TRINITY_DN133625_c0_g1_i2.p1  ORF type:complete len:118 (+),score=25.58 TRINITY_DN133625_c0_g1_i2:135-488(+)
MDREHSDNIYKGIPKALPEELIEVISGGKDVTIERIVSRQHSSPEGFWYNQDTTEFVIVLEGEAELEFKSSECDAEIQTMRLKKGDYTTIPARKIHRVSKTSNEEDTIWLAVHFNKC